MSKENKNNDYLITPLQRDLIAGRCIHDDISPKKKEKIDQIISKILSDQDKGYVLSKDSERKLNKYYRAEHAFLQEIFYKQMDEWLSRK